MRKQTIIIFSSIIFILFLVLIKVGNNSVPDRVTKIVPTIMLTADEGNPVPKKDVNEVFDVENVLQIVNQYRSRMGAPELVKSTSLCELAQNRAKYLIADNMKAFNESGLEAHIGMPEQAKGYNFAGEALMGIDLTNFDHSANLNQDYFENWKKSPSHNKVLTRTVIKIRTGTTISELAVNQGCVAKTIDGEHTLMVLITGYK